MTRLPEAPILSMSQLNGHLVSLQESLEAQRDADHGHYQAEHDKLEQELVQQGRREVVEWVEKTMLNIDYPVWLIGSQADHMWQAYLKEKGLK